MSNLSVILPVYNGLPYLRLSLESLTLQSLQDFELLIINDGSIDDSELVINEFDGPRIRYYKQANKGLAATLNSAISLASGDFIARQDQDDISFPSRLQKQIEFLKANPDVAMVGTSAEIWEGDKKTERLLAHPPDDASIKFNLLFDNPFVHSSVMIRRSALEKVGGYCEDKKRQPPEDYELWSRVSREYKVANLPDVLLAYREVPGSMSRTGLNPFLNRVVRISAENLAWYSGRATESPGVIAAAKLAHGVYEDIPRGVSFAEIEAVVKDAALSITQAAEVPFNTLDHLFQMRIAMLKYHYFQYKTGGWLRKLLGVRIEGYFRGMARRILSVIR